MNNRAVSPPAPSFNRNATSPPPAPARRNTNAASPPPPPPARRPSNAGASPPPSSPIMATGFTPPSSPAGSPISPPVSPPSVVDIGEEKSEKPKRKGSFGSFTSKGKKEKGTSPTNGEKKYFFFLLLFPFLY